MDSISNIIILLGALVVWMAAMNRFNKPQTFFVAESEQKFNLLAIIKQSFGRTPSKQGLMLRPPRANTTVFRYRLYQTLYALLAIQIYFLLLFQPEIQKQFQEIIALIVGKETSGIPDIANSGPLVMATFVVLILPNVPPFRWADSALRRLLYERALIPAQQLREINRLKMADYNPPAELEERARKIAIADSFRGEDIVYDAENPTTKSLWCKSLLLIESIKDWEVEDKYMTAFAVLKESDSEQRTVDVVKEMKKNLMGDARTYFNELRYDPDATSRRMANRDAVFRHSCHELLNKIYALLAGISLHSHYSENERITQFSKMGFRMGIESSTPLPDSNDMIMLTLILTTVLILPLAYKLDPVTAIMIGAIMLSAVLSPVLLARLCPRVSNHSRNRYGPNVAYPLLSGGLAVCFGFIIFSIGGLFIEIDSIAYCGTGYERYFNCSYPFGILHATIALLLATRLPRGRYPNIKELVGWQRYRQWGNFKDAAICAVGMFVVAMVFVAPLLEPIRSDQKLFSDLLERRLIETAQLTETEKSAIRLEILLQLELIRASQPPQPESSKPDQSSQSQSWMRAVRIAFVSFILGFVVPTWYRAQKAGFSGHDRRKNFSNRKRFESDLATIRRGNLEHT